MNSRFAENIPIHCVPMAELKAANERLIEVFVELIRCLTNSLTG